MELSFPMYIATAGEGLGDGAIYVIENVSLDGSVRPDHKAGGFDYPSGIAVTSGGVIYVTEKMEAPLGTIKEIRPDGTVSVIVTGLHYPEDIVVDSFGKLYIAEADSNRVSRYSVDGELELSISLTAPKSLFLDWQDRLFVTEVNEGKTWVYDADGNGEVVAPAVGKPYASGKDMEQNLYVLATNTGVNDTQVMKVHDSGSADELLGRLVNGEDMGFDAEDSLYVLESHPANRVIRYSKNSETEKVIAVTVENPRSFAFTPY